MARKKYSCDFETTTKLDDCRVWAYGWMEIGKRSNYRIGNSMDEFMEWVEQTKGDLYFHNLRFDGEFIVNYLLSQGWTHDNRGLPKTFNTVISKMGQWYMIDICYGYKGNKKLHTVIYDSLKKLPFPVKKIGKDFGLEVLKIDHEKEFYERERPIGHEITEEEYAYVKNDIEVIACALEIQFSQGLTKMTNGSDSMKGYKDTIGKKLYDKLFPVLSLEADKNIRLAYRGGFTWLNDKHENATIGRGMIFDVNSLYPAQMYSRPLPYGMPIQFDGKYEYDDEYPLHIQHIRCEFALKDDYIPTVQIKQNLLFKGNEYLKTSGGEVVDLYMTNIDLEILFEHYEVYDIEYMSGWKFKQKIGLFKDFIDYWTHIKTTSEGAIKQLAKLMLNSLYGKFASNPDVTGKYPELDKTTGAVRLVVGDEEYKDPVYTPMGIFITSWARYTTITTAQKCYDRIIYCDTDSIHLTGTEMPEAIQDIIDDNKLGYWAHESTYKKAKYIRQKTYMYEECFKEKYDVNGQLVLDKEGKPKFIPCVPEEATKTKVNVKCAGMPDAIKQHVNFDNFEIGFSSFGKLAPKHVRGGVVLIDSKITIK